MDGSDTDSSSDDDHQLEDAAAAAAAADGIDGIQIAAANRRMEDYCIIDSSSSTE